ncbi:hypothetical protein ACVW0W_001059 [Bradyrhizobium sp. USDA 4469]
MLRRAHGPTSAKLAALQHKQKDRPKGGLRSLTNPVDFSAGFLFGGGLRAGLGRSKPRGESEGDFLDVLGGGGEQALASDGK